MDARTRAALPTLTLDKARQLRRGMTDAERALWYHLRAGRLDGLKFRRQHPIPPYVVDFYCDAARLVIELDGSQHTEEHDLHRTRFLESKGLTVLRFWNDDVLVRTQAVLEVVWSIVGPRPLTPTPLPVGEGL
ncbi:MAG: DNA methylase [Lysobacterales bacterium RIFOXYD1_FULL_69_11]|nr:MAG: DNA methylase [Xanthomonadales bacterium RIFOXYA1_FULL_69_10]OHE87115.1 MAG: DNA methylase [Xanthomonadales bacterium RIFOXYD1_FULL_69_11]